LEGEEGKRGWREGHEEGKETGRIPVGELSVRIKGHLSESSVLQDC